MKPAARHTWLFLFASEPSSQSALCLPGSKCARSLSVYRESMKMHEKSFLFFPDSPECGICPLCDASDGNWLLPAVHRDAFQRQLGVTGMSRCHRDVSVSPGCLGVTGMSRCHRDVTNRDP